MKLYPVFEPSFPDDASCHAVDQICVDHDLPVLYPSGESISQAWRETYNHPREIVEVATRFRRLTSPW